MPIKVLLAEDDLTMASLLKTLLDMEGFSASIHTGDDACLPADIRKDPPDVLLLDVNLKSTSGLDVLKELRADPSMKKLKIIMISGMDFNSQCMRLGADGFLLKPYMPDDLIAMIKDEGH